MKKKQAHQRSVVNAKLISMSYINAKIKGRPKPQFKVKYYLPYLPYYHCCLLDWWLFYDWFLVRILESTERNISRVVKLVEANGSGTVGKLYLTQSLKSGVVTITGHVSNLKIGRHGFHVHNNGETGNECKDAGGHFNPDDVRS